jgi:hypothetical protein
VARRPLLLPFAVIYCVAVALFTLLVALPFALVLSLFSRTRWIEAETRWPAPILVRWRTTAAHAEAAMPSSSYADAGERPRLVVWLMR